MIFSRSTKVISSTLRRSLAVWESKLLRKSPGTFLGFIYKNDQGVVVVETVLTNRGKIIDTGLG